MPMVHLRKLEPTDLPFLYQWENDAVMWADSDTHNPLSRQDLRDYLANTSGDIYRDGQLRLIAEREGAVVGCIDLFDFDARNRKAALGMYVAPAVRRSGVGRAMVQQVVQYAFEFLHLRMVYAVIGEHNAGCTHLYRSLGFTPSSPLRAWTLEGDAVLWQQINPAYR